MSRRWCLREGAGGRRALGPGASSWQRLANCCLDCGERKGAPGHESCTTRRDLEGSAAGRETEGGTPRDTPRRDLEGGSAASETEGSSAVPETGGASLHADLEGGSLQSDMDGGSLRPDAAEVSGQVSEGRRGIV